MTKIFHLSLPVSDLHKTRQFYEKFLGAKTGRVTEDWLDLWLFGVQITIQRQSDKIQSSKDEKLHLGGTLPWNEWEAARLRLEKLDAAFDGAPIIDETAGQAKMYLTDPDGYVIELKAYRDMQKSLRPPA